MVTGEPVESFDYLIKVCQHAMGFLHYFKQPLYGQQKTQFRII